MALDAEWCRFQVSLSHRLTQSALTKLARPFESTYEDEVGYENR